MMTDFIGQPIEIGDNIVYEASRRTGSSTIRNMLFRGKVIGFTPKMVIIDNLDCEEKIMPHKIVVINEVKIERRNAE